MRELIFATAIGVGLCASALAQQPTHDHPRCARYVGEWDAVQEGADLAAMDAVIARIAQVRVCPNLHNQARGRRDEEQAWQRRVHVLSWYDNFLEAYPNGFREEEARRLRAVRVRERNEEVRQAEELQRSRERADAAWPFVNANSRQQNEAFIRNHPNARPEHIQEAQRRIRAIQAREARHLPGAIGLSPGAERGDAHAILQSDRVTLRWTAVPRAAHYIVSVTQELPGGAETNTDYHSTSASVEVPLQRGGVYRWNVQSCYTRTECYGRSPAVGIRIAYAPFDPAQIRNAAVRTAVIAAREAARQANAEAERARAAETRALDYSRRAIAGEAGLVSHTTASGNLYSGQSGVGSGVMTFVGGEYAGDRYAGDWGTGGLHGVGVYRWAQDSNNASGVLRYEGQWVNGTRSGLGVQYWSGGNSFSGEWRQSERAGPGVLSRSDQTRYEGRWVAGVRGGLGVEWSSQGAPVQVGRWTNGALTESMTE